MADRLSNSLNDAITKNHQWHLVNTSTTTGNTSVPLPSATTWEEVMVVALWSQNNMVSVSCSYPKASLDSKRRWIGGCYSSASDFHTVQIDITQSAVNLECWKTNGTDYTTNTQIRVYVR